ncbi:MAG: hypothetical protein HYX46_11980 [Betaproteobacteria bacterium]|nr:hypothetical protein [Betaproteobacteria bacterium]
MNYFILAAGLALLGVARAGHEFPFYPSFYPQEITVEALDARSAAERLAKGTLHAYAAGEIAAEPNPAKLGTVASLGGYVVATFDPRAPGFAERSARCAAARSLKGALGEGQVWHPYPVTPFHSDYLHHADRAEAARAAAAAPKSTQVRAKIEVIDAAALAARTGARYNGWSGPPWVRRGWFHAYLLLGPSVSDAAARARIEDAVRRLMRGEHRTLEERVNLERNLVALLQSGCERVVLGYTVRRERYGADYSQGVENVGYDAIEGLASAIFPRTVKLRDFPWNGWLSAAAPAAPSSAWNPVVGGFGDAFGRLVLAAVVDLALFPSPHGGGWIENRVSASIAKSAGPIAVPEDALLPEPGSGRLVPVGRGKTAASRIAYRVRNSAFHDGTPMSVADVLYAYAFAAAWGAGAAADPDVAEATALARERLRGVRVLRVETETLAFGEDKLTYQVPVIEVYLDAAPGRDAIALAPPWSALPWHLLALLEEGARRGIFVLSAAGAARRGLPELDPVRNTAIVRKLADLLRDLEERAYVPPALAPYVNAEEARNRYRRLREFQAAHGHWLVTNGPYLLDRWDGTKAVLGVFRDPSYPKGLGNFNAYAVPLMAHVTRIERRGQGAEVQTETEWLERLGRDVRVVRGSFAKRLAERLVGVGEPPVPVCHYLLIGPDGAVTAAGAVRADGTGACRLEFPRPGGRPPPGGHRLVVAAVLEDNAAHTSIRIVQWDD